MRTEETAVRSGVDALDVFVELLLEIDSATPSTEFYDRLCEAVCRLTTMRRAVIFLYETARRTVVAEGSHGVDRALLADVHGTIEETPVAQRALEEDRVVELSEGLERNLPPRYAGFAGIKTLTCTPVAAGGRWFGVIFADRGGSSFTLTEPERHAMWSIGKTAALAASARMATREQELARSLRESIELAREVHDRVVQRLFGVSLALSSEHDLDAPTRARCREEMQSALADLRSAMQRPLAPRARETRRSLREELEGLVAGGEVQMSWDDETSVPSELEPLAQTVLFEALRNARKHATPQAIQVSVGRADGVLVLEVVNDGAASADPGRDPGLRGMGLRLAALEALQHGGVLEFGPVPEERWRVRLLVPPT